MELHFSDIVKLIMKETGKGYNESAKILDKVVADVIKVDPRYTGKTEL